MGILAYNKAQMLCLNSLKVLEGAEIERNAQLAELVTLNGGVPISFSENIFSLQAISCEFEQWYAQAEQYNPVLQWIKQDVITSYSIHDTKLYELVHLISSLLIRRI